MRLFLFVFCLSFLCVVPLSATEPYVAVIKADWTTVRGGPSNEFYPTSQLRSGDKVEIYYERGDWLAIRPPIGSFSWVAARYVDLDSSNIGTVQSEGLASRIGSDFSDNCDTVQVNLKKGEQVHVLDRRDLSENAVSPIWLKIVPPSGEFRWIHRSSLEGGIQQAQYQVAPHQTGKNNLSELPPTVARKSPAAERVIPIPKIASTSSPNVLASSRPMPIDPFQKAFNELQQEAYGAMTRPVEDDVFVELIQRADELHHAAITDQDLEKTYHLLESLKRTRTVRQELTSRRASAAYMNFFPLYHQSAAHTPAVGSTVSSNLSKSNVSGLPRQSIVPAYAPMSALQTTVSDGSASSGINVAGFDIVGRLGEFENAPKGHPPFAVVNEKEQIICLISPSARLDLSSYVGQHVGINGILGFYEKESGKPAARHITARSVQAVR